MTFDPVLFIIGVGAAHVVLGAVVFVTAMLERSN